LELKREGVPIGVCGLLYRKLLDETDIGFALLPRYWRCGYAFEAASALMDYGQSTLGITRIVGLTCEGNFASIKMLEKLGLRFERIVGMSDDDPGTALYS
ncbi:MAG: GNAT family N-acetyltransferase, partial [bacterium]|nr:GNAT family N-acetyltransferase [bacterium]